MALFGRRRSEPAAGTPLSRLMSDGLDEVDTAQLIRVLARSVVHVPTPDAAAEPQPRLVSAADPDQEGVPLYVIDDEDGQHALLYSSPAKLVEAFGPGVTAASIPFSTLLAVWPAETDLVLDAFHRDNLVVPVSLLHQVALEVAGVPTTAAVQPSPDDISRVPQPDFVQLIGVTRELARSLPEVQALYRAETVADVPSPRPVIDLVVDIDDVSEQRVNEIMTSIGEAIATVEPRPLRMRASVEGRVGVAQALADRIRSVDAPYYRRSTD